VYKKAKSICSELFENTVNSQQQNNALPVRVAGYENTQERNLLFCQGRAGCLIKT
jgi:hypothetical protein